MVSQTDFNNFDLYNSTLSVWIFKKSVRAGLPVFTGRWVTATNHLKSALKETIATERNRITELSDYSLLAQTNEGSALTIPAEETHAGLVTDNASDQLDNKRVRGKKDIENAVFYAVKLTNGDSTLFAISKTDTTWKAKRATSFITAAFSDNELTLEEDRGFTFSKKVDLFVFDNHVIISNKANFESVLSYKAAHEEDFGELLDEQTFADAFDNLDAIKTYVGTNKIQLRRASAIKQKGHYRNEEFMENLRQKHSDFGLEIEFNSEGKIVPNETNCKDIFQALLDHRLRSGFSNNLYDVPDVSSV